MPGKFGDDSAAIIDHFETLCPDRSRSGPRERRRPAELREDAAEKSSRDCEGRNGKVRGKLLDHIRHWTPDGGHKSRGGLMTNPLLKGLCNGVSGEVAALRNRVTTASKS